MDTSWSELTASAPSPSAPNSSTLPSTPFTLASDLVQFQEELREIWARF